MGMMWKKMIRRVLMYSNNDIEREQLKPGDHIFTWNRGHSHTHHGIYVGDGKVIHLARGDDDGDGVVCSTTIQDFLSGGGELCLFKYCVNPIYFLFKPGRVSCTLANSDPPQVVLPRASSLLGLQGTDSNEIYKKIFNSNSEVFAVYCKTGLLLDPYKYDESSRSALIGPLTGAIILLFLIPPLFLPSSFTGLALVLFGIYCFLRTFNDVKYDSSAERVAVGRFDRLTHPPCNQLDNRDTANRKRRRTRDVWSSVMAIILLLRLWYWTPENTIFLWIRYCCTFLLLCFLLYEDLKKHCLKLTEPIFQAISNKVEMELLKPGDHIYTWNRGYSHFIKWRHGCWYTHHGIYVGDGKVIHLARVPDDRVVSSPSHSLLDDDDGDRVVCSTSIQDFLSGGELCRFDYGVNPISFLMKLGRVSCTLAYSDPPQDALHRASFLLGRNVNNDSSGLSGTATDSINKIIFNNSSEVFALYCKTGLLLAPYMSQETSRSGPLTSLVVAFVSLFLIPRGFLPASFAGLALVVCGFYCFVRTSLDVGLNSSAGKVAVEKFDGSSYPRTQRDNRDATDRKRRMAHVRRSIFAAILLLRIWYWTPRHTILGWIRYFCWAMVLSSILSENLEYYGFKLSDAGEFVLFLASFATQFAKLHRIVFFITKSVFLYLARAYD